MMADIWTIFGTPIKGLLVFAAAYGFVVLVEYALSWGKWAFQMARSKSVRRSPS